MSETEGFDNDGFGRLRTYTRGVPGNPSESWAYSYTAGGSITGDVHSLPGGGSVARSFERNNASPHQVSGARVDSALAVVYSYDGNGNQTARTAVGGLTQERTFNEFDMPWRIANGDDLTTIDYDAFGQRTAKRGPSETTLYGGDLYECAGETQPGSNDVACAEHCYKVFAAGRQVAQVTRDALENETQRVFIHSDHRGSSTLITDMDGEVVETRRFDPFGAPQSDFVETSLSAGFTGHEHDVDLDLINMRGRLYDPELHRFITPDPYVFDPYNPHAFNRYSYVQNKPFDFVDPSGFQQQGPLNDAGCQNSGCSPPTINDYGEWTDGTEYGGDRGGSYGGSLGGSDRGGSTGGGTAFAGGGGPGGGGGIPGGGIAAGPGAGAGSIPDFAGPDLDAQPFDGTGTWQGGKRGGNNLATLDCKKYDCSLMDPLAIPIPGPNVVIRGGPAGAGVVARLLIRLFGKGAEKAGSGAATVAAEAAEAIAEAAASRAAPTAAELLVPGGVKIGQAGANASVRTLQGGEAAAQEMFQKLATGGTEYVGTYAGRAVTLPGGGFVGIRTVATGTGARALPIATIDVNISGIAIRELKYLP